MCASFALLIFLRCQFMVIFYVPNIKTQKVVLHSPLPTPPDPLPASQANQIRFKLPGDFVISSFVFTCFHDSVCPTIRPSVQFSSASDPRLSGLSVRSRAWWLRQQQQQQLFHGIRSRRAMLSRRKAHFLSLSLSGMSANGSSEYSLVC